MLYIEFFPYVFERVVQAISMVNFTKNDNCLVLLKFVTLHVHVH